MIDKFKLFESPDYIEWDVIRENKLYGSSNQVGSDMTDWDSKKPLAWRQTKYQKNVTNFEDYSLNESRLSDLRRKYDSIFGEELGEKLWEIDATENKAYVEWLLTFYRKNKEDIDKIKDFPTILQKMIEKYHNNKQDYSTEITKIRTLDDFKKVLDEKDDFEEVATINNEKICKVWFINIEWIVFQPYKYEVAKFANRKDRENNWCTTYNESHFDQHNGKKGGIIYCTNKLDSTQDVAFELFPNEIVKKWNYKDQDTKIDIFQMKDEFEEDSEIYEIFDDEIEHEAESPTFTRKELEEKAREYYSDLDLDSLGLDIDTIFDSLDDNGFVEDWIKNEIDYYSDLNEFFSSFDSDLNFTFKYIWKEVGMSKFAKFLNISDLEVHKFLNVEGYPYIDDFIEFLETYENKKVDKEECYEMMIEFFDEVHSKRNLVEYYMNERYTNYSSRDIYEDFYGDASRAEAKEIMQFASNSFDEDDYKEHKIQTIIYNMSDEDILEIVYDI